MMSQIKLYIKNIIKTSFILCLIILGITDTIIADATTLGDKTKSLNNIDSEIIELEKELQLELSIQQNSTNKIKKIELALELERTVLIKNREKKKLKETLLNQSNFILDSLTQSLNGVTKNRSKVMEIIEEIKLNNTIINTKIRSLNDSITYISRVTKDTKNELVEVKKIIKNMIKELITIDSPSEIAFILESNTWDDFILNSTLYKSLIDSKEIEFELLLKKYKQMALQHQKDSTEKEKFQLDVENLNVELNNYTQQLNNFIDYQNVLDDLINDKQLFINKILSDYETIGIQLNKSKQKVVSLEIELDDINQQNKLSVQQQQQIESQLLLKKEARKIIRNEILKLTETYKKLDGVEITKLKGKLPWPINGEIITRFGKYTNPDTKVIIDYDLIEIQPKMNNDEKIVYLTKQIDPKSPNKKLVKKLQKATMNMKEGDQGFGVFGPKTTKIWKKYNNINLTFDKEPIYSIHQGVIESIRFVNPIVGIVIIIRHDNNYFSVYNGNIEVFVMEGAIVKVGSKIGEINKQNILSFQLWKNKTPINPENWLIKK